jgi:hypothetical protein
VGDLERQALKASSEAQKSGKDVGTPEVKSIAKTEEDQKKSLWEARGSSLECLYIMSHGTDVSLSREVGL